MVTLKIYSLSLGLSLTNSCAYKPIKPLTSLCVLDFKAQVCWINKAENKGFSFAEMSGCNDDKGGLCYFAIDEFDLARTSIGLSRAKAERE